ncbi:carbohydrate ABC transporter permease [Demequina flava]|uniref:carbohydrate ABC transporter permease n=1 Tax=Demequina flava TaxID=1095025 RepID=UPI000B073663|nr:carbohydrate ABC transporter permease [Demequina flava]
MTATDTAVRSARANGWARAKQLGPREWLTRIFFLAVAIFFALFFLVPIAWLLLAPTKTQRELLLEDPFSVGTWDTLVANFESLSAYQNGIIWESIGNSALYAGGALIITLVASIPAGYALALIDFKGRALLLTTTLVVMLIPNTALVLPVFLEMSALGLVGTAWSVILPFSFFPFGVYLTYIYFSTTVSKDLLNAARIDGAGEFKVFWLVAMPLAKPVIALVGFFSLVQNWNNYFLPFFMVNGRDYPVQVRITEMLANVPAFNPTSSSSVVVEFPVLALATLLSVTPVLLVFLFSQRFLVSGMTAGGLKG